MAGGFERSYANWICLSRRNKTNDFFFVLRHAPKKPVLWPKSEYSRPRSYERKELNRIDEAKLPLNEDKGASLGRVNLLVELIKLVLFASLHEVIRIFLENV